MPKVTFRCDTDLVQRLDELSDVEDTTRSHLIRELLKVSLAHGGVIDPETQLELLNQQIHDLKTTRQSLQNTLTSEMSTTENN